MTHTHTPSWHTHTHTFITHKDTHTHPHDTYTHTHTFMTNTHTPSWYTHPHDTYTHTHTHPHQNHTLIHLSPHSDHPLKTHEREMKGNKATTQCEEKPKRTKQPSSSTSKFGWVTTNTRKKNKKESWPDTLIQHNCPFTYQIYRLNLF